MPVTFMAGEIREIPAAVSRLLTDGAEATGVAAKAIDQARPRWASVVGRGTSWHAATYARYLLEACAGLPAGLGAPSVTTTYRAPIDWRDGLVIAVSQSGQSPDVVAVVTAARAGGATTVAVTNDPTSPLARAAEHALDCHAGVERSVAATKTYVTGLVALASLVARLPSSSLAAASLDRVPDVLDRCLEAAAGWVGTTGVVEALSAADHALVLSRGFNLATALEVALKLKECGGMFADGYSAADLEHGPLVLARPDVPILAFRPDGAVGRRIDELMARLTAAGAPPWIVAGRDLAGGRGSPTAVAGGRSLALPLDLPEPLTPAALVLPGQLLAEAVACRRGRDPDDPPGLRKVTLTL